jgi:hypothetical protein
LAIAGIHTDISVNQCFGHAPNFIFHVFAINNLLTLFVNKLTLPIHDIIILKNVLPDIKVTAFHPFLGILDSAGEHFIFDGGFFIQTNGLNQTLDFFRSEYPHQIIFQ